jgi:hypothetical protein
MNPNSKVITHHIPCLLNAIFITLLCDDSKNELPQQEKKKRESY